MANSPTGDTMAERIVRVLDTFGADRTIQTAAQIGRRSGLPSSTAHRIVDELVRAHVLNGLVNPTLAEQQQARERVYREALDALAPAARARVLQDLGVRE